MRKIFIALITVLAFALMATSCTAHVTGGGFVKGLNEGTTANFGFNFQCDGDDTKGHLTYHDGDLKIKGTIDHCSFLHRTVQAYGDWVPQGKSDLVGGRFMITGSDEGEPGVEDTFKIKLWDDGSSWSYTNKGVLLGGNLQEH